MKEDYCNYELSLLAKSKGFDIDTKVDCWVKLLDDTIIHNSERLNIFEHDRCEYYLSQPSLNLLSKWLREKHNIVVNVKHITHNQKYGFSVTGKYNEANGGYLIPYDFKGFNTYEKALEESLFQALKLLP